MKKLNINDVIEEYRSRGFVLYQDEWLGTEKPCKCMDSDGYLYEKTLSNIRQINVRNYRSFVKPFDIRNKYYWDNVLHYMQYNVSNGAILLSSNEDFTSANSKLLFKCPRCGKTFRRTWKSFIDLDNKVCTDCYKDIRLNEPYIEKRRNNIEKYIVAARNNNLTLLDSYVPNVKSKVNVEDSEGYRGVISASRLLEGSTFERWSTYRNPYIHYNLQRFININGFNTKVVNVDKNSVELKCECGEIYKTTKDHLVYGCQFMCTKCTRSMSLLEQQVEKWLINNHIAYERQKTFDGLVGVGGKLLRFDFYVKDYNTCIEVNGKQHYQPVNFGGNKAQKNFEIVKEHDGRKLNYCNINNIKLVIIPYWMITKSNDYINVLEKIPIKK